MKLKINKACDLNSISVLPPHSRRRTSGVVTGAVESSIFGRSQASASQQQLRSQTQSQHSFSQGVSSQHGLLSQISQNTLDDAITTDQRINSQDRESSAKRASCLLPINYPREESQVQISRPTANLMRKWSVPEYKCQISEELEHRIGLMETSLSRFGMILDSIQSDIMQANKGTKEVAMEMESMQQKMIVHDDLLQLMNKGQEDLRAGFEGGLKALSDELRQTIIQDNSREISLVLSALPEKVETRMSKSQNDLLKTLRREIQAIATSLKVPNQESAIKTLSREIQAISTSLKVTNQIPASPMVPPLEGINHQFPSQDMHPLKSVQPSSKVQKAALCPKVEKGGWKSVKHAPATLNGRNSNKSSNQKGVSPIRLEREVKVIVESDEDIDGGFSCLFKEKERGNYSIDDARQETARILRKARRRKRKNSNHIVID